MLCKIRSSLFRLTSCRGGSTSYLGPYPATYARLLGAYLAYLVPYLAYLVPYLAYLALTWLTLGLPGPYLAVEHCTLPGLTVT